MDSISWIKTELTKEGVKYVFESRDDFHLHLRIFYRELAEPVEIKFTAVQLIDAGFSRNVLSDPIQLPHFLQKIAPDFTLKKNTASFFREAAAFKGASNFWRLRQVFDDFASESQKPRDHFLLIVGDLHFLTF